MAGSGDRFVIWGSGGTAKKLFDVVVANGGAVIALFDRDPKAKSVLDDVPIHHGEEGLRAWAHADDRAPFCNALVGAGSAPGAERLALLHLLTRHHLRTPSVFHPRAWISPTAEIARGCAIFAQAIVDAHCTLGEACIVNDGARVGHDCVVGNAVHVAPGAMILGGARIGNDVLIGANAVILPGVEVGAGSIVGAGAVVLSNLDDGVVAVGNPARVVKSVGR